ncbi:MAG: hypothetical protein WDN31_05320 [Hyphomicrobium sp.]
MISHTVPANGRTASQPVLTPEEAVALFDRGFRFSIFRPELGEFRLSLPLQVAEDRTHGTLAFMQEEDGRAPPSTVSPSERRASCRLPVMVAFGKREVTYGDGRRNRQAMA